ncbi:MAG: putative zinc-binding metallopeptidase [Bdellovibrionales bacterium]|nr:putative zinc-binding metallopeptidase [Bdellovibrionales bacterium]
MAKNQIRLETSSERQILSLRFCDLPVELERSDIEPWINEFFSELGAKGIHFRPHLWISDEWFSPEGVPGIAIPFYLCHPRLRKLHRKQLYEVEGGSKIEFMRILRHEAGHAFDTAFDLSRQRSWKTIFGDPHKPYPTSSYTLNPYSNRYVHNIRFWYAQSHPLEDFAETFAVWLRPSFNWKRRYRSAPAALKKLQYVDAVMSKLKGQQPKVRSRRKIDTLAQNRQRLLDFYEREKQRLQIGEVAECDHTLRRLFSEERPQEPVRANAFLRKYKVRLRKLIAEWSAVPPLTIDLLLDDFTTRAGEMKLYLKKSEHDTLMDTLCILTHEVVILRQQRRIRLPV